MFALVTTRRQELSHAIALSRVSLFLTKNAKTVSSPPGEKCALIGENEDNRRNS